MKKLVLLVLVVVMMASLAGCGATLKDAEAVVGSYYEAVNAADYDAVYKLCSPEFFQNSTQAEFRQLLETIASRLGGVVDPQRESYKLSSYLGTDGSHTLVNLVYSVDYSGGETAEESFTIIKQGGEMKIRGYNISSLALIINEPHRPPFAPPAASAAVP